MAGQGQVRIEPGALDGNRMPQVAAALLIVGFLGFPLVDLVLHPTTLGWTLGLGGMLAFGALVVWAVLLSVASPGSDRAARQLAGAVVAAVLPVAPLGVVWLTTACYFLMIMVPLVLSARWWAVGFAAVLGLTAIGFAVVGTSLGAALGVMIPATVVGLGTASVQTIWIVSRRIVRERVDAADSSALAEGERLARDVNDLLEVRLTALAAKADLVQELIAHDAARAAAEAAGVGDLARSTLAELGDALSELRSVSLRSEVRTAVQLLATAGIETRVRLPDQPIDRELSELLGRILREATANVLRHSGATSCQIDVAASDSGVSMCLADDGPDARSAAGVADPPFVPGNGLNELRARVESAGGVLEWGLEDGWFRLRVAVLRPGP